MVGQEYKTTTQFIGVLDLFKIKSISIGKEAVKEYVVFGNQKSYYIPTGMNGPMVKLVGSVPREPTSGYVPWNEVYSNDYLKVIEFGFPTWAQTLSVDTKWWVDSISLDTSTAHVYNGKIRYECTLDLYKQTTR